MQCHEVDYHILGSSMQALLVELDPNETVIAEGGAMAWMDEGINFDTKMGDGSNVSQSLFGKLVNVGKRTLSGEDVFITHFTNASHKKKNVAFTGAFPGQILPIDLKEHGEIKCQKDAFLCAAYGTQLDIAFHKRIGTGFFGGEGFILQRLVGDGNIFLHAGGNIVKKTLNNEKILVDTGCLVAFTNDIDYSIQKSGNLKSMLFGGEGFVLATLEGTGDVYLQTLPFPRLIDVINEKLPNGND